MGENSVCGQAYIVTEKKMMVLNEHKNYQPLRGLVAWIEIFIFYIKENIMGIIGGSDGPDEVLAGYSNRSILYEELASIAISFLLRNT